ncbi:hypothetical protein MAR_002191 [Mya arenaria]|uniref:Uncharacterized protein n=1 Tax=Mya arenaria TaxID=6604 RepID=A0ABY7FDU8_MYAAR|nr:hypothetical protein MAR_002191 [Mya arenaria]
MQSEEKFLQQNTNAGRTGRAHQKQWSIPDIKMPSGFEKKSLEVKALTTDDDTSTYTRKFFSYAVSQNLSDPDGIKRNLTAIVSHNYEEHGGCD